MMPSFLPQDFCTGQCHLSEHSTSLFLLKNHTRQKHGVGVGVYAVNMYLVSLRAWHKPELYKHLFWGEVIREQVVFPKYGLGFIGEYDFNHRGGLSLGRTFKLQRVDLQGQAPPPHFEGKPSWEGHCGSESRRETRGAERGFPPQPPMKQALKCAF